MAKTKRSTLPKDFSVTLEQGDIQKIKNVFDTCDVNAVGGYDKSTALGFDKCPNEIVRWLVTSGADLSKKTHAKNLHCTAEREVAAVALRSFWSLTPIRPLQITKAIRHYIARLIAIMHTALDYLWLTAHALVRSTTRA